MRGSAAQHFSWALTLFANHNTRIGEIPVTEPNSPTEEAQQQVGLLGPALKAFAARVRANKDQERVTCKWCGSQHLDGTEHLCD